MTSFSVKNYKCLADVTLPLTPLHVIIGQNDSGKTALLEAILALHRSTNGPLENDFPSAWDGRELVYEKAVEKRVVLEGIFSGGSLKDELRYYLEVEFPESGRDCQAFDEYYMEQHLHSLARHYQNGSRISLRSNLDGGERQKLEQVAAEIGEAQLYRLDPKQMMIPAAIDPTRKFRMDEDGFGLATLLDDLLGYEPERFIRLRNDFINYYPQFQSVRIESERAVRRQWTSPVRYAMGDAIGKGIYFESRQGHRIRAEQASDGAILFLGFLALIHSPQPPKRLLIEEPERGVYPKRLEEVIALLRRLSQDRQDLAPPQIIMTTHSPYLLSSFQPEEVTLLSRDPITDAVRARPLRDAPHIQDRLGGGEFYLGELWFNLSEEELFADA